MPKCSVKKCKNNTLTTKKQHGISYFRCFLGTHSYVYMKDKDRFPQNELQREKWRLIIKEERGEDYYKPNDSSVVCSQHFSESDMYSTKKGFQRINKNAVPKIETSAVPLPSQAVTSEHFKQPKTNDEGLISPKPSELSSDFNKTKISFYKKIIRKCNQKLQQKSNLVQNLKKQNNRLRKNNNNLKQIIQKLKSKGLADESLCTDLNNKYD